MFSCTTSRKFSTPNHHSPFYCLSTSLAPIFNQSPIGPSPFHSHVYPNQCDICLQLPFNQTSNMSPAFISPQKTSSSIFGMIQFLVFSDTPSLYINLPKSPFDPLPLVATLFATISSFCTTTAPTTSLSLHQLPFTVL